MSALGRSDIYKMDEVDFARDFLNSFFDSGLPEEHHKDLKKWRFHVINEKQYKHRHGARHVFAHYEETLQLIEVAHILLQHNEILKSVISNEIDIVKEKADWHYFPKNVSQKALLNPQIPLKKFFKKISVAQYKVILHEWLNISLSNKAAQETLCSKEIIDVYGNLKKLYYVIWLIHQRL